MKEIILYFLAGSAIMLAVIFLTAVFILIWIGSGEPDVNGDPERDSTVIDFDIPN